MPINAAEVQWDAAPAIDPAAVQWDKPAPKRAGLALADVPGEAWRNLPASAGKFARGIKEAVMHPLDTLATITSIPVGVLGKFFPDMGKSFPEGSVDQAVNIANQMGGVFKDRYGDYESVKRTFAEDPVGAAADMSTLLTGGAAGVGKLGMAGTAKVLGTAGAVTNPLAPVGLVAKTGKLALKGAAHVPEAIFNPKNALYMRAAEGRAPEILNALRRADEIVPGSVPTAAQAAVDTGIVGFQKLGKSAAAELGTAYKGRGMEQAAAQTGAIRRVGKTPAAIEAAEDVRGAVTAPMYKQADATLARVDAEFGNLLSRPSMGKVMDRAQRLAAEKNIPFKIGETTPEMRVPSSIVDEFGRPLAETVVPPSFAELPGTSIHFIKQAFDDLLKDPTAGIAAAEASAIKGTRSEFLKWVERTDKNPMYGQARQTFREMSVPINQMEVGQYLEQKLLPVLGGETAGARAGVYATALRDAPGTIKKSLGGPRFKSLEEIFANDKASLDALYSVRDDLARQAKSKYLAGGTIPHDLSVSHAAGSLAGESALPNLINRTTTVANDLYRRLRGQVDKTVAMEIAAEMLVPEKAAAALAKAYGQQQRRQLMGTVANAPFKAVYDAPAVINALAPENQNAMSR